MKGSRIHLDGNRKFCNLSTVDPRTIIGSFSSYEGDGNEKKSNRFVERDNKSARSSRFVVHFLAVTARLRRENS